MLGDLRSNTAPGQTAAGLAGLHDDRDVALAQQLVVDAAPVDLREPPRWRGVALDPPARLTASNQGRPSPEARHSQAQAPTEFSLGIGRGF